MPMTVGAIRASERLKGRLFILLEIVWRMEQKDTSYATVLDGLNAINVEQYWVSTARH